MNNLRLLPAEKARIDEAGKGLGGNAEALVFLRCRRGPRWVAPTAHEACPTFPGRAKVLHVGVDDPGTLARSAATKEEALVHYRRVRDELRALVESLPGRLREAGAPPQTRRPGS